MTSIFKRLFQGKSKTKPGVPAPAEESHLADTAPLAIQSPPAGAAEIIGVSPLRVAHAQSVGRMREHNEDVLLTFTATFSGKDSMPSLGVYIVADGMGGHNLGERASAVAARTVASEIARRLYINLLGMGDDMSAQAPLQDILLDALVTANTAVVQSVGEGGTTATVAVMFNDQAVIGHVGDSRAYLIANNTLEQITRDHSLVQRLQELGQLTAAEAAVHPQRNVLYRAIGQGDGLEVDVHTHRLAAGMKLLLCSDGLWGLVDDAVILATVHNAPNLQEACKQLVDAANDAGGPDNITVVLIEYGP